MSHTKQGDRVTLEMSRDEYNQLLLCIGYALGAAVERQDKMVFNMWLKIANRVNEGSNEFIPYGEIPE